MKECNLELLELRRNKVLDTSSIVYKTLASYNEMAFSLKSMLNEANDYMFCYILRSHISKKTLTLDNLNLFNEIFKKNKVYKELKLKKIKDINDIDFKSIINYLNETLNKLPLFIKLTAYFDNFVRKNLKNEISASEVIAKCFYAMSAYSHDIDEEAEEAKQFNDELSVIKNLYKKEKINL